MWSLSGCMDNAPVEGYTERDHRPSVKLVRIPTARKPCKQQHSRRCGRCGRYFAKSCGIGSSSCALSVSSSDDQGALKAAFNACVADKRTVDGRGTLQMRQRPKSASTYTVVRTGRRAYWIECLACWWGWFPDASPSGYHNKHIP